MLVARRCQGTGLCGNLLRAQITTFICSCSASAPVLSGVCISSILSPTYLLVCCVYGRPLDCCTCSITLHLHLYYCGLLLYYWQSPAASYCAKHAVGPCHHQQLLLCLGHGVCVQLSTCMLQLQQPLRLHSLDVSYSRYRCAELCLLTGMMVACVHRTLRV